MKEIYLALAIHNHQPVGNFPWVFEQAYRQSYLPMLEALEKHPTLRLSLHYSGPLLDWLKTHQPSFLTRLAALVRRGQVEMVGGAYYEPILPIIPDADKHGQIAMMASFISQTFGTQPTGLWLAERVWEPHLAKPLAQAGVAWTVVDDTHFKLVGLEDEDLFGYYTTEEQGYPLKVFATSKYLRYSIPWRGVEEVIAYLRAHASAKGIRVAVMGDDGEKFGTWPGTYRHCWEEGWMEEFFSALSRNRRWLHTIPLGEFAARFPPLGRIYLPCASYDEMMEWALPPEKSLALTEGKHRLEAEGRREILPFLHGGFWRHFLVKYPEANWMQKKMLRVSEKVHRARPLGEENCGLKELWQGQCNCPYWHGIFGGLYLADIRATTYHHLVRAEQAADRLLHREESWLEWEEVDFDGDGVKELVIESDLMSLYFKPGSGGNLWEWDLRRPGYNLLSTLPRRPEAYHQTLKEEMRKKETDGTEGIKSIHDELRIKEGVSLEFHYDRLPRASLLDHILPPSTSLRKFASSAYREKGSFVHQPYEFQVERRRDSLLIRLRREGSFLFGREELPFLVEKKILVERGQEKLEITYRLTNQSQLTAQGLFAPEWNINLLGGGHNPQAYYLVPGRQLNDGHLDSRGELKGVAEICLGNKGLGVELRLSLTPPARLWRFPVEALSNSEGGLEKVYQASCLVPLYSFHLAPGESLRAGMRWSVK